MICPLDARRNPILVLSIVAFVYVAADRASGVGLLATLAGVPMLAGTLLLTAVWSWWHFTAVAVGQTCLFFVHAVSSLRYPWFVLLLSGCAVLAMSHAWELPR